MEQPCARHSWEGGTTSGAAGTMAGVAAATGSGMLGTPTVAAEAAATMLAELI